ncbi:hypothetical protein K3N28_07180 [Glycomyces sp. TRM65418]|uniref:hypothetical protein n=1 Tax=Glycomyces sp. TRM65418 TaxID=2867006 RepID=UPI001CE67EDA|nr:hypothetical protein [Glycomyces sp. TRM65418]MCC3762853.1 hypothetical protein [Glycomyces sp. TRM65418]QZD56880.1 hypothetical protein K3N28_07130 [Glycomyces sp. TRM65418]
MKEFLAPFGRLRLWPAVGAVAAAGFFWVLGLLSGVDFSLWQLVLLALAALLANSVVNGMRADTEKAPELIVRTVNEPSWRPFTEVNRWEDRLIFAEAKPGRFEGTNAKRQLVELAAERLRLRRGLSLTGQPDECRALLGERTFQFLTGPVPDCPTPWQLDEHLQAIEEI